MGGITKVTRREFIGHSIATTVGLAWNVSGPVCSVGEAGVSQSRPKSPLRRLTVYSWSDAKQPGITPMTWQPMSRTGPALMLRGVTTDLLQGSLVEMVAHGLRIDHVRDWMMRYFKRFHPPPQRIVMDDEAGPMNYWGLTRDVPTGTRRIAIFEPVWKNATAYAKLPEAVKAFEPKDFASPFDRGRQAVIAWQRYTDGVKADALHRAVYEPAVNVFGGNSEVSNYGDTRYEFPIYDLNGWPENQAMMGNWSSPSCYLWNRGQRYGNLKKPIIWNNFIDSLNYVRSCLNRSWRVAPWVSYPSFHEGPDDVEPKQLRWLWRELILHMKASGVRDFLYWNPAGEGHTPPGDDNFAARVFKAPVRLLGEERFEPIKLDADEVRTGEKVTRYGDWGKG